MTSLAYLGPQGTYSEKAAKILRDRLEDRPEIFAQPSIEQIAIRVASRDTKYGLIPYYNLMTGVVQESLPHVYDYGLKIISQQRIPICHSLGLYGPIDFRHPCAVYSHPKALAQCSDYLAENFADSIQVPTESTVAGIMQAKRAGEGVVIACKDSLLAHGLEVHAEDVGNKIAGQQNYTEFHLVSTEEQTPSRPSSAPKTMLAISPCAESMDLLTSLLLAFQESQLQNAKIHSAPSRHCQHLVDTQLFFVEVDTHSNSAEFQQCLERLRASNTRLKNKLMPSIRILGTYDT